MDDLDVVDSLLKYRMDKVKEILLRCCQEQTTRNEMMASLIYRSGHLPVCDPSTGVDMASARLSRTTSQVLSHSADAFPPQHTPARRFSSATRQYSLLSPPRTASSVTSHSVKDDVVTGEDVLLSFVTEQGTINKQVVRMRTAPVEHSLIGEDVVVERELRTSLAEVEETRVSVPSGTDSDYFEDVQVSFSIHLTWRRPSSNLSHATLFYVVPKGMIDSDLVLGSIDSGKTTSGMCILLTMATL